ncbi:Pycsar system effector family protein [Streptomyces hygroscopicus]|uniref:Pycsar system effector family protein n=1 Tax=Streptomyces hygroscopicus TaxID=1912 RepID=UPI00363C583E
MSDIDARLDAEMTTALAEISRTDGKAGVLLTSFSLPLAVLVAAVPGHALPPAAAVLVATGVIGLVTAMLVVLLVVRPRLAGAARGSFLYWAQCTPEVLLEDLQNPGDQTARAAHVIRVSRIARRKYWGLRLAGDVTAISLIALAAALITALT